MSTANTACGCTSRDRGVRPGPSAETASRRRTGDVRHDLAVFTELLRDVGVGASPGSLLQAVQAVTRIRLDQRADFRVALECCLTAGASDRALFDIVFDTFWSAEEDERPIVPIEERGGEGHQGGGAGQGATDPHPVATPDHGNGRQPQGERSTAAHEVGAPRSVRSDGARSTYCAGAWPVHSEPRPVADDTSRRVGPRSTCGPACGATSASARS